MVDKLASYIVNKIFGRYFEGLDNISIGIFSSSVNLSNLKVKDDIFDDYDLPFTVKQGILEDLHISVHFRTKPFEIHLSGLYVVISPKTSDKIYSEDKLLQIKYKRLRAAEILDLDKSDHDGSGLRKFAIFDFIKDKVLLNIKINIENVHIRYEDFEDPSNPFSFGVTIERIHVQTSDSNWNPSFLKEIINNEIKKLIDVEHLSIYLNSSNESLLPHQKMKKDIKRPQFEVKSSSKKKKSDIDTHTLMFIQLMNQYIYRFPKSNDPSHLPKKTRSLLSKLAYILDPFTFQIKLTKYYDPLQNQLPMVTLDCDFVNPLICLRQHQYETLISLFKYFDVNVNVKRLAFSKPSKPMKESPYEWWQYAIRNIYEQKKERIKKLQWHYMVEYRNNWKTYVHLYEQKLKGKSLKKRELETIKQIETAMSFYDIIYYRKIASLSYRKNKEYKKKSDHDDEELKELFKEIGLDENYSFSDEKLPNHYVKAQLKFKVNRGLFQLINHEQTPIVSLQYDEIYVNTDIRKNKSFSISGQIGRMVVREGHDGHALIYSKKKSNRKGDTNNAAIVWNFHVNKGLNDVWNDHDIVNYIVYLKAKPLAVHLNSRLWVDIKNFFLSNQDIRQLTSERDIFLDMMKSKAGLKLKSMILSKNSMVIDIHLPVPHFIFDLNDKKQMILKIKDTKVQFNNKETMELRNNKDFLKDNKNMYIQEYIYDTYTMLTEGVHAYIKDETDNNCKKISIIDPFDTRVMLKILSLPVKEMPYIILNASLDQFNVHSSTMILQTICDAVNAYIDKTHQHMDPLPSETDTKHDNDTLIYERIEDYSNQRMHMVFNFNLNKMCLYIHDYHRSNDLIIRLNAYEAFISSNIQYNTFNTSLDIKSISIVDDYSKISKKNEALSDDSVKYLLESSEHMSSLHLNVRKRMDELDIGISIGTYDVYMNRTTYAYLITCIFDYFGILTPFIDKIQSYLSDIYHYTKKETHMNEWTRLKIDFEQIHFHLNKQFEKFFTLTLGHGVASIFIDNKRNMEMNIALKGIDGYVNEDIKWKRIIHKSSDKLIELKLKSLFQDIHQMQKHYLILDVDQIEIVLLSRITTEVAYYFVEFWNILYLLSSKIHSPSMMIHASIHHPLIIIPQSSNHDQYFQLDMGEVKLYNEIFSSELQQKISIDFEKIRILSCQKNMPNDKRTIMDDLTFIFNVELYSHPEESSASDALYKHLFEKDHLNDLKISMDIESIDFQLSDEDVKAIFYLFEYNLSEPIGKGDIDEVKEIVSYIKRVNMDVLKHLLNLNGNKQRKRMSLISIHVDDIRLNLYLHEKEPSDPNHLPFLTIHLENYDSDVILFGDDSIQYKMDIQKLNLINRFNNNHLLCIQKGYHHQRDSSKQHFSFKVDSYPSENIQFISLHLSPSFISIDPMIATALASYLSVIIPNINHSINVWLYREQDGMNLFRYAYHQYKYQNEKKRMMESYNKMIQYREMIMDEINEEEKALFMPLYHQEVEAIHSKFEQFKEKQFMDKEEPLESQTVEIHLKFTIHSLELNMKSNDSSLENDSFKIVIDDIEMKYKRKENHQDMRFNLYDIKFYRKVPNAFIKNKPSNYHPYDHYPSHHPTESSDREILLVLPFDIAFTHQLYMKDENNIHFLKIFVSDEIKSILSFSDIYLLVFMCRQYIFMVDQITHIIENQSLSKKLYKPTSPSVSSHIELSLNHIDFSLINDTTDMIEPLFKVYINDINLFLFMKNKYDWKFDTKKFMIEFYAYNHELSTYEPIIEPSKMSMDILATSRLIKFNFDVIGTLNINLSKSFIYLLILLKDSLDIFMNIIQTNEYDAFKSDISLYDRNMYPYIIQNDTSKDILIHQIGKNKQNIILHPDEQKRFQHILLNESNNDSMPSYINLSLLLDENNHIALQVPIDRVHQKLYNIHYHLKDEKFVHEVIQRSGTRIIIVRTPNIIINETCFNIEMRIGKDHSQMFVVPQKSTKTIPFGIDASSKIYIRPIKKDYIWSGKKIKLDLENQYMGKNRDEKGHVMHPWACLMNISSRNLDFIHEKVFRIVCPLVLENLLPVDAYVKIVRKEDHENLLDFSLSSSKSKEIYLLPSLFREECYIQCLLPDSTWSSPFNIQNDTSQAPEEIVIIDSNERKFKIHFVVTKKENKCYHIILYSKHWIINQTGLNLSYRSPLSDELTYISSNPTFQFDPKGWYPKAHDRYELKSILFSDDQLSVQVGNGDSAWSHFFHIDQFNDKEFHDVKLSLQNHRLKDGLFCFTVRNTNIFGRYWRTNEIKIIPSFMIVNQTKRSFKYRQVGCLPHMIIEPNDSLPFHWTSAKQKKQMEFQLEDESKKWSAPISLSSSSHCNMKLRDKDGLFSMSVTIYETNGTTVILLQPLSSTVSPYKVTNLSQMSLFISQKGMTSKTLIQKGETVNFIPENPLDSPIHIEFSDNQKNSIMINSDSNTMVPTVWDIGPTKLYIVVHTWDHYQHITIHSDHTEEQIFQSKEMKKKAFKPFQMKQFSFTLNQIGISIVDQFGDRPARELMYLSFDGVHLGISSDPPKSNVNLNIKRFQIDQNYTTPNRMILCGMRTDQLDHFLKVHWIMNQRLKSVTVLDYFDSQIQFMDVRINKTIIALITRYVDDILNYIIHVKGIDASKTLYRDPVMKISERSFFEQLFIKNFLISGLTVKVSLVKDDYDEDIDTSNLNFGFVIASFLFRSNTKEYYLKINPFDSKELISSYTLKDNLIYHYKRNLFTNAHNIIKSFFYFTGSRRLKGTETIRLPRFIPQDNMLMRYDLKLSYGQFLLKKIKGMDDDDKGIYLFHCWIDHDCFIGSTEFIGMVDKDLNLIWKEKSKYLRNVTNDGKGTFYLVFGSLKEDDEVKGMDIRCDFDYQVEIIKVNLDLIVSRNAMIVTKHV